MPLLKPTATQVREYRDTKGCSLQEAKCDLAKQWRQEMLELAGIQLAIGSPSTAVQTVIEYLKALEDER